MRNLALEGLHVALTDPFLFLFLRFSSSTCRQIPALVPGLNGSRQPGSRPSKPREKGYYHSMSATILIHMNSHPVAYCSRKMLSAKRNYETHDVELLAIAEGFPTWRHYLERAALTILVLSDHKNLKKFVETTRRSGRQIRWAQELRQYDFKIDHHLGSRNSADALSTAVIKYHGLPDSIVTDRGSLFTSKVWSFLCYYLSVKRRLSTAFLSANRRTNRATK